jgi:hypothetical protein
MHFIERGQPVNYDKVIGTAAVVNGSAQGTAISVKNFLDAQLRYGQGKGPLLAPTRQPVLGLDASSVFLSLWDLTYKSPRPSSPIVGSSLRLPTFVPVPPEIWVT